MVVRIASIALGASLVSSWGTPLAMAAEMGRAPVATGTYLTGEGGYLRADGPDVLGGSVGDPVSRDVNVAAEDGWHAGASIGFAGIALGLLPANRIELYYDHGASDGSAADRGGPGEDIALSSVDDTAIALFGGRASTEIERRTSEAGLRFALDQDGGGSSLSWLLTPYLRVDTEDTSTDAVGTADSAWRSSAVETWMYGLDAAVEPEMRLTGTVSLVGRLGVGFYGYSADGEFRSGASVPGVFDAALEDDVSGVGFRGRLGAGLKVAVSPGSTLTGFAEADYLSAVGSAELPANTRATSAPASVTTDDGWDLRVGARLSIGLSSP